MNRRQFFSLFGLGAAATVGTAIEATVAAAQPKPQRDEHPLYLATYPETASPAEVEGLTRAAQQISDIYGATVITMSEEFDLRVIGADERAEIVRVLTDDARRVKP